MTITPRRNAWDTVQYGPLGDHLPLFMMWPSIGMAVIMFYMLFKQRMPSEWAINFAMASFIFLITNLLAMTFTMMIAGTTFGLFYIFRRYPPMVVQWFFIIFLYWTGTLVANYGMQALIQHIIVQPAKQNTVDMQHGKVYSWESNAIQDCQTVVPGKVHSYKTTVAGSFTCNFKLDITTQIRNEANCNPGLRWEPTFNVHILSTKMIASKNSYALSDGMSPYVLVRYDCRQ